MSTPKKPRKQKSKKINVSARQHWETILRSVTKEEVPVEMLDYLTVNLIDGTKVNVNIKQLIAEGRKPKDIESEINDRLSSLDAMVEDVDFFICIDSVANVVQPVTDKILKNL